MANFTNKSGTLVGSILETGGYIYQSSILDSMQGAFTNQIGALLYIFAISLILFQFAVNQKSNGFMWLLIGPPLFFSVIGIRDNISYAEWSFGSSKRDQSQTEKGVEDISPPQVEARVSKVFKRYVEMISATNTSIIDTITRQDAREQRKEDLWFLIKGEFLGMLSAYKEDDPGLIRLIQKSLLGDCRKVFEYARQIDDPFARLSPDTTVWGQLQMYANMFASTRIEAKAQYEAELQKRFFLNDKVLSDYIANNFTISQGTGEGVNEPDNYPGNMAFSCADIWAMTYVSIIRKSEIYRDKILDHARELGIERGALVNLIEQASGDKTENPILNRSMSDASAEKITKVIAKYVLRNESRARDKGSILAQFVERNDIRNVRSRLQGFHSYVEQARLGGEEWSERERLIHTASSLPYYQGLALYFLGMSFPFFAFLLLIPGKMGGFLLWFMLWLWIKSWDIGLAIVMQLDDVIWSFYSIQRQKQDVNDELSNDFQTAIISLQNMDPSFQMAGYYTILGVCLLAIPPVSAQLILGGLRAGSSAISAGVSRYSEFHAEGVLAGVEQTALQRLKNDANLLKQEFVSSYSQSDMQGAGASNDAGAGTPVSGLSAQSMQSGGKQNVSFPGRNINEGNHAKAQERAKMMRAKAGVAAITGGVNFLGGRPSGSVSEVAGGLSSLASIPGNIHRLFSENSKQRIELERDLNYRRGEWDADVSEEAYRVHERMAIYQAIPVPWTNFMKDQVWESELNKAIAEQQIYVNESILGIDSLKDAMLATLNTTKGVSGIMSNSSLTDDQKIQQSLQSLSAPDRNIFVNALIKNLESVANVSPIALAGYGLAKGDNLNNPNSENFEINFDEVLKKLNAPLDILELNESPTETRKRLIEMREAQKNETDEGKKSELTREIGEIMNKASTYFFLSPAMVNPNIDTKNESALSSSYQGIRRTITSSDNSPFKLEE